MTTLATQLEASFPPDGGLIPRDHPEGTCADCGGPNVCWHAPNDLWNAIVGDERGLVLCPTCFVVRGDRICFEATGKLPTGWRVSVEDPRGVFGEIATETTQREERKRIALLFRALVGLDHCKACELRRTSGSRRHCRRCRTSHALAAAIESDTVAEYMLGVR